MLVKAAQIENGKIGHFKWPSSTLLRTEYLFFHNCSKWRDKETPTVSKFVLQAKPLYRERCDFYSSYFHFLIFTEIFTVLASRRAFHWSLGKLFAPKFPKDELDYEKVLLYVNRSRYWNSLQSNEVAIILIV